MHFCCVILTFFAFLFAISHGHQCGIQVLERGVEYRNIRDIVRQHNVIRRMAVKGEIPGHPKAINMKTMKWDGRLALSAQEVADNCKMMRIAATDDRFEFVGQNLLMTKIWSSKGHWINGSDWNGTIDRWYKQHEECNFFETTQCPHYSQLVAAKSIYVGCGYIAYQTSKHYESKIYVCHYGPGYDQMGLPPYRANLKQRYELNRLKRQR